MNTKSDLMNDSSFFCKPRDDRFDLSVDDDSLLTFRNGSAHSKRRFRNVRHLCRLRLFGRFRRHHRRRGRQVVADAGGSRHRRGPGLIFNENNIFGKFFLKNVAFTFIYESKWIEQSENFKLKMETTLK